MCLKRRHRSIIVGTVIYQGTLSMHLVGELVLHLDRPAAELGTLPEAFVRAHHQRHLLLLHLLLINQLKWLVIEIHFLGCALRVCIVFGGFTQAYEHLLLKPLLAEGALGLVLISQLMLWMMVLVCIPGNVGRVMDKECRWLGAGL
jgi:hypothetical protein